jgi:hypothetical protein
MFEDVWRAENENAAVPTAQKKSKLSACRAPVPASYKHARVGKPALVTAASRLIDCTHGNGLGTSKLSRADFLLHCPQANGLWDLSTQDDDACASTKCARVRQYHPDIKPLSRMPGATSTTSQASRLEQRGYCLDRMEPVSPFVQVVKGNEVNDCSKVMKSVEDCYAAPKTFKYTPCVPSMKGERKKACMRKLCRKERDRVEACQSLYTKCRAARGRTCRYAQASVMSFSPRFTRDETACHLRYVAPPQGLYSLEYALIDAATGEPVADSNGWHRVQVSHSTHAVGARAANGLRKAIDKIGVDFAGTSDGIVDFGGGGGGMFDFQSSNLKGGVTSAQQMLQSAAHFHNHAVVDIADGLLRVEHWSLMPANPDVIWEQTAARTGMGKSFLKSCIVQVDGDMDDQPFISRSTAVFRNDTRDAFGRDWWCRRLQDNIDDQVRRLEAEDEEKSKKSAAPWKYESPAYKSVVSAAAVALGQKRCTPKATFKAVSSGVGVSSGTDSSAENDQPDDDLLPKRYVHDIRGEPIFDELIGPHTAYKNPITMRAQYVDDNIFRSVFPRAMLRLDQLDITVRPHHDAEGVTVAVTGGVKMGHSLFNRTGHSFPWSDRRRRSETGTFSISLWASVDEIGYISSHGSASAQSPPVDVDKVSVRLASYDVVVVDGNRFTVEFDVFPSPNVVRRVTSACNGNGNGLAGESMTGVDDSIEASTLLEGKLIAVRDVNRASCQKALLAAMPPLQVELRDATQPLRYAPAVTGIEEFVEETTVVYAVEQQHAHLMPYVILFSSMLGLVVFSAINSYYTRHRGSGQPSKHALQSCCWRFNDALACVPCRASARRLRNRNAAQKGLRQHMLSDTDANVDNVGGKKRGRRGDGRKGRAATSSNGEFDEIDSFEWRRHGPVWCVVAVLRTLYAFAFSLTFFYIIWYMKYGAQYEELVSRVPTFVDEIKNMTASVYKEMAAHKAIELDRQATVMRQALDDCTAGRLAEARRIKTEQEAVNMKFALAEARCDLPAIDEAFQKLQQTQLVQQVVAKCKKVESYVTTLKDSWRKIKNAGKFIANLKPVCDKLKWLPGLSGACPEIGYKLDPAPPALETKCPVLDKPDKGKRIRTVPLYLPKSVLPTTIRDAFTDSGSHDESWASTDSPSFLFTLAWLKDVGFAGVALLAIFDLVWMVRKMWVNIIILAQLRSGYMFSYPVSGDVLDTQIKRVRPRSDGTGGETHHIRRIATVDPVALSTRGGVLGKVERSLQRLGNWYARTSIPFFDMIIVFILLVLIVMCAQLGSFCRDFVSIENIDRMNVLPLFVSPVTAAYVAYNEAILRNAQRLNNQIRIEASVFVDEAVNEVYKRANTLNTANGLRVEAFNTKLAGYRLTEKQLNKLGVMERLHLDCKPIKIDDVLLRPRVGANDICTIVQLRARLFTGFNADDAFDEMREKTKPLLTLLSGLVVSFFEVLRWMLIVVTAVTALTAILFILFAKWRVILVKYGHYFALRAHDTHVAVSEYAATETEKDLKRHRTIHSDLNAHRRESRAQSIELRNACVRMASSVNIHELLRSQGAQIDDEMGMFSEGLTNNSSGRKGGGKKRVVKDKDADECSTASSTTSSSADNNPAAQDSADTRSVERHHESFQTSHVILKQQMSKKQLF